MSQPSIQDVDAAVSAILGARSREVPRAGGFGEVFAERLFSLRHAESIGRATREVRIAPGTVVTPLARDYLKQHGIGLSVVAGAWRQNGREPGEWAFAIGAETGLLAAFRRALLDGPAGWTELEGSADVTAGWVVEKPGRGALLVTDDGAVAVWRSCRWPGVRAAVACDVDSVDRASRRLGVNLLVVEPSGKSVAMLRQMSLAYRRAGAPRIPDWIDAEGMR